MQQTLHRYGWRCGAALALVSTLTACASTTKVPMYHWGSYSTHVYSHLQGGEAPEPHLLAMEQTLAQAEGQPARLPPGYLAHLGLLYLQAGATDQALQAWAEEKRRFPEAASYIDYLVANLQQPRP